VTAVLNAGSQVHTRFHRVYGPPHAQASYQGNTACYRMRMLTLIGIRDPNALAHPPCVPVSFCHA